VEATLAGSLGICQVARQTLPGASGGVPEAERRGTKRSAYMADGRPRKYAGTRLRGTGVGYKFMMISK
jgi:hypothetical protein